MLSLATGGFAELFSGHIKSTYWDRNTQSYEHAMGYEKLTSAPSRGEEPQEWFIEECHSKQRMNSQLRESTCKSWWQPPCLQ